ncbi:MAG: type VI secretion system amidase effector protein Tae4 [Rubrivivax sp.]
MTTLQQRAQVSTNMTPDSVCRVNMPVVTFSALWAGYPASPPYQDPKTGKPPAGFENQCAIKISVALHGAGIEMKSFKGAAIHLNGKKTAIRASELAGWLKLQPFCGLPAKAAVITGSDWQERIKDRTGIVYFEDYWARQGETATPTGDHIDLWDGSGLTYSVVNRVRRMGVQQLRWLPWPLDGLNFSDLAASRQILFWEIK